ncbi:MAG: nuclease domain-containing protein [Solibacillus sp.]
MKLYSVSRNENKPVIIKELYENNGLYYAFEYEKDKKQSLKIGIVCDEATHISVKQHDVTIQLEQSANHIWHHAEQVWEDGLYGGKTDGIFGFNVGGDFYVQAWNEDEFLAEAHVAMIPQVFTLAEYRSMQQEVVQLIESFSIDAAKLNEQEAIYLKRIQRYLYPLSKLVNLVDEFTTILDEIIDQPAFKLIQEPIKKHKQNIKRWTPQLILQESVTQKEYLTVQQSAQSVHIIEHQMIAFMLQQLLKRIEAEMQQETRYTEWLTQDKGKLQATITKLGSNQQALFANLRQQLTEDLGVLTKRKETYKRLHQQITSYTELDLFQVEAVPVEETHLFKMDVKYQAVFELYHNFDAMLNEQQQSLQPFIKSLLKSPVLYEIWIFLKLVEQLKKWGFSTLQFIKWIKEKYSDAEQLVGFDEVFELSAVPFRVRVMFNKYLPNLKLQPDYILGIQNKACGSWQWHTADAKYKTYNDASVKVFMNDINHSAVRYYDSIHFDGETVKSSVIIHPTANVAHWNMRQHGRGPHAISHFFVQPFDTSMLRVYFKRLLHHFGQYEHICPTCNASTEGTPKYNGIIYTYECNSCAEVWVSSHCWSCKKEAGTLYKYAIDNYNHQVNQEWNVHCPRCAADANHYFNQGDSVLYETYTFAGYRKKVEKVYETQTVTCSRCNGRGHFGKYSHIEGGVCFKCRGAGTETRNVLIEKEIAYAPMYSSSSSPLSYQASNAFEEKRNTQQSIWPIMTEDDLPF